MYLKSRWLKVKLYVLLFSGCNLRQEFLSVRSESVLSTNEEYCEVSCNSKFIGEVSWAGTLLMMKGNEEHVGEVQEGRGILVRYIR